MRPSQPRIPPRPPSDTIGTYGLLAMAFNSFGIELDEGLVGFPD